jgi:hypothetical protein
MSKTTNAATKGVRMQRVPHHDIARGLHVTVGIAMAALFCAGSGLISPAKAQLFGSSYTSTTPGDCRVAGTGNGVDDSATRICPGKAGRPVAKPMLAVTQLPPGAVCHVAYVDVKANPNANELARKAADEIARDFKCGKDEVKVIGVSGRAVELATRR